MNLADQVKAAGVVGAGGAGFPTHVKLEASVDWYLANGAECEPLIHKDRELMTHFASQVIKGLTLAAQNAHAAPALAIKKKNHQAVAALNKAAAGTPVQLYYFDDYYPAGDEYELVHTITGNLIPPQGLPLDVGCVVNNVETLHNICRAAEGIPVTDTFLTITGLVKKPLTTWIPLGMSVIEVLKIAGGATVTAFSVMDSGLMMGKLITDLQQPVTKTTGGLIVLPTDHSIIQRYSRTQKQMDRIGFSACDQCSYCTELCPRYLLGYDVQPHLVMRSLGFTAMGKELWNSFAQLCCRCGLCTLYSCPEALYPREACIRSMNDLRQMNKGQWQGSRKVKPHFLKEMRRVPLKQLVQRLGVHSYEKEAEFVELPIKPKRVTLLLKQHVGVPAKTVVAVGDRVSRGQLVARVPEGQLGAHLHASMDGKVTTINHEFLVIEE
ncbi:MAG: NADH dehydrogenase subunit [Calditrichaeota bacterium]|nr:MAG: NADH dehydrogenase subunit [Calditrichota bacterium]